MAATISKRDIAVKKKVSGWDNVIADAKKHINRLQAVIGHAQNMKETGEPWPGTQTESQTRESCHSV